MPREKLIRLNDDEYQALQTAKREMHGSDGSEFVPIGKVVGELSREYIADIHISY
jgi:hypothetical protein